MAFLASHVNPYPVAGCLKLGGGLVVRRKAFGPVRAGLGVAGTRVYRVGGAPSLVPPARLLTAVANATRESSPVYPSDDDDESSKLSWYRKRMNEFEEDFRAVALYKNTEKNTEMVKMFEDLAQRAVDLMDRTVAGKPPQSYSHGDLIDMMRVARSFRRVVLEAKGGYVLAESVVAATKSLKTMMDMFAARSPGRRIPPYPSVVPYAVDDSESDRYFKDLYMGFSTLIMAAECVME